MTGSGELCFSCGYDLAGTTGTTCPECGQRAVSVREAIDRGAVVRRRRRWLAALVIIVGVVVLGGVCSGAFSMLGG